MDGSDTAVLVGLFTLAGALGVAVVNHVFQAQRDRVAHEHESDRNREIRQHEVERERREDERRLRDEKRTRLRVAYADLLSVARALHFLMANYATAMSNPEAMQEVNRSVDRATKELERSYALVLLESDANHVAVTFDAFRKAFNVYAVSVEAAAKNPGSLQPSSKAHYQNMSTALAEVEALLPRLERAAREHLEALEAPI